MVKDDELPAIFRHNTPQNVENKAQEAAASVIAGLAEQYPAWTIKEIERLKKLFGEICSEKNARQAELIHGDFYRIIHDIKGQGATFGYPLMTQIGTYLCALIKGKEVFTKADLCQFDEGIRIMQTILEQKMVGEDSDGMLLVERLTKDKK